MKAGMRNSFLWCSRRFFLTSAAIAVSALNLAGCPSESQFGTEAPPAGDQKDTELVRQYRITPQAGPVEGGTVITIVGKGFVEGTSVEFGVTASPEVHVLNDQVMTAVAPAGDPGAVDLVLRFPQGSVPNAVPIPVRVPNGFQYYILPPDDGTDTDGDGLTDYQELTGWEVWVDAFGLGLGQDTFGNVARYTCISDPNTPDTDGDGLTDYEEFLAKSDARKVDTDGDGLFDYEEVVRWHTSPTSIDSDGDSRGSDDTKIAPNPKLFDGAELHTVGFEPPQTGIFISEYVEGSDFERAIELYNPSDTAVNLSGDGVSLRTTPVTGIEGQPNVIALTGTIPPKGTFVIADSRASQALRDKANQLAMLPFTGLECVYVERAGTVLDSLGSIYFAHNDALQPSTHLLSSNFGTAWQDFVVEHSGVFTTAVVQLKNNSSTPFTAQVSIQRDATVLGTTSVNVAANDWQNYSARFEIPVYSGDHLRLVVTAPSSAAIDYVSSNLYAGGASSFGANADLFFVTRVAPSSAQTDGDLTMRDATLRRRVADGTPDSILVAPVALGAFQQLPGGTIDGLGRHDYSPVPVRIVSGGTSPSLADTDGDGVTDYYEVDTPLRTPVIADLPKIKFELVDPVAVNLRVEYSDSVGTETSYGTELSRSETSTHAQTDIESTTKSWNIGGEIGFEGENPASSTISGSYGEEYTEGTEITEENAKEAASAYSEEQSASRERTVTASRGTVSVGLRAVNSGNLAYTLSGLSIAVRQFVPAEHEYRSLTTLLPPSDANTFTLAPGDSTSVMTLRDDDVDPGIIRAFLANPSSVLLEPTTYQMLNGEGTNFIFTTEQTFARTALVVVDYGDGNLLKQRVATNVNRLPNGAFAGIRMADVMQELGLGYTTDQRAGQPSRLTSVEDIAETAYSGTAPGLGDPAYPPNMSPGTRQLHTFWYLVGARGNDALSPLDVNTDFDDIVLQARDEIRLAFVRDDDRDGLNDRQEFTLGTSDTDADSDNDGLSDWFEANVGWTVTVTGQNAPPPYQVFGTPTLADSDGDGWSDLDEYLHGTDPHNPDTDEDTVPDSIDPLPLQRAFTLFVKASAAPGGNGMSWETAYQSLNTAIDAALNANFDSTPANDVRQIWVAEGTYLAGSILTIFGDVSVYGGFAGDEMRRTDRNPDPATNNTRISGLNTGQRIVHILSGANRLDGFTLERASSTSQGGALYVNGGGANHLANLLLIDNSSTSLGGALYQSGGSGAGATYENVIFSGNSGTNCGGAVYLYSTAATFINCQFQNNTVNVTPASVVGGGGALYAENCSRLTFEGCAFRSNNVTMAAVTGNYFRMGGGMLLVNSAASSMVDCVFRGNEVISSQGDQVDAQNRAGGGLATFGGGSLSAANCTFSANRCPKVGGGIFVHGADTNNGYQAMTARFVNCTIAANQVYTVGSQYSEGGGMSSYCYPSGSVSLINTVLWGNSSNGSGVPGTEREQLGLIGYGYAASNCCIQHLDIGYSGRSSGTANTGDDPFFQNINGGDFRILTGSACIDAGNRNVDWDVTIAGTQGIPDVDIRKNPRIIDGDGDGYPEVDIGAVEFQGN